MRSPTEKKVLIPAPKEGTTELDPKQENKLLSDIAKHNQEALVESTKKDDDAADLPLKET